MISNNKIFDLNQFDKIEDIIFIDEPILTHYKRGQKHFLLYLVDTLIKSDIYIFIEVEKEIIYKYLTKSISLRNIILRNENIGYLIEQDFKGNIENLHILQEKLIDEDYLPLEDSFLQYEPTINSYYYNFIEEFKNKSYLSSLRKDAFYLKFKPNNDKYADTIGLNELANNLISNLSKSFKNFLEADFYHTFKEKKTNKKQLNKIFKKLLPDLDLRMVDLRFGSFEVGLAVDEIMKTPIEDKKIKEWAVNVGYKYKDIVLDEDYDKENVDEILNSYSVDERKKIFGPIFKITENPNYSLQIKASKSANYSTIKLSDKSDIERIIPQEIVNNIEPGKDYQIVQFTTLVDKNDSKKSIQIENTLFNSTDNTDVILTNKDFEKYGYEVYFEISIPLNIKAEKNTIILTARYDDENFEVIYHSDKIADGLKKITSNIYEYILNK